MEEEPREQSPIEKIQELASTAPEAVEAEFARTKNTWLECFGSRLFQIETWLNLRATRELIPAESYQTAAQKLQELVDRFSDLKTQYPDRETIPPEEIKQELFEALRIL